MKQEEEEKRLKLHKAEISAVKKEFEEKRKKVNEEKVTKVQMRHSFSAKPTRKVYDIEFTKDRQEMKKRKQRDEEAKLRAAEEEHLRAIAIEKLKAEKLTRLLEKKVLKIFKIFFFQILIQKLEKRKVRKTKT